jgi:hypothetical protein
VALSQSLLSGRGILRRLIVTARLRRRCQRQDGPKYQCQAKTQLFALHELSLSPVQKNPPRRSGVAE